MPETARRTAVVTLVAGGIVVAAIVLWQLRLVLGLLFFAFIIAAAIRPGSTGSPATGSRDRPASRSITSPSRR